MPLEKVNGRVGTALFMFLVFATMSLLALGFPERARLMPLLVGIPGTLLGLVQILAEIRATRERRPGEASGLSRAERHMLGWTLAFFLGLLTFGFVHAGPVLVFAFMLLGRGELLRIALASAACTWAVLYGLFEKAFEIPLFAGLLVEWLAG